mmetsp:Transcript_3011/g.4535  ORF Transcript_3011/g.4535 Transcript_3011/m.4535 type:complete len:90 (+) Transcript_3011:2086-2355(+)
MSNARWEALMEKAFQKASYEALQELFVSNLSKHAAEGGRGNMIRRYRELSVRFHPDKHMKKEADAVAQYQIAFQALNEARSMVLQQDFV